MMTNGDSNDGNTELKMADQKRRVEKEARVEKMRVEMREREICSARWLAREWVRGRT